MCTQYTSSEVTPNCRMKLQVCADAWRCQMNAKGIAIKITPSLMSTSSGLSSQKSDFVYNEIPMLENVCAPSASTKPASPTHSITCSICSSSTTRSRLPKLKPNAT